MSNEYDSIIEAYISETSGFVDKLETLILDSEDSNCYTVEVINEIFRIVHTIKGSSAMMEYNYISMLAHSVEDLFYFIREDKPHVIDYKRVSDLILKCIDFIKAELEKVKRGDAVDGECDSIIEESKTLLMEFKNSNLECGVTCNLYKAVVFFEDDCRMENIRAYTLIDNLKKVSEEVDYMPKNIMEDDSTCKFICQKGFRVFILSGKSCDDVDNVIKNTAFVKEFKLQQLGDTNVGVESCKNKIADRNSGECKDAVSVKNVKSKPVVEDSIRVKVERLDKLMDLVEEMVIAESMVIHNPDLKGLKLNNFNKASRQLHKITGELQDTVMSVRMVPVSIVFRRMNRIVHDMSKKLNKQVELKLIGEDTEVDKNIIEHISDPLMHLVRNCIDHGIEPLEKRRAACKNDAGTVTLEAKNEGSYVIIIVKDDGAGLNKEKILQKAGENGILKKPVEKMDDRDIYNLIFTPGFSTNEEITEFSGRGVGMDVVVRNIEEIGGNVSVDSIENKGCIITIKIPLTLAIIDGMNVKVGNEHYTIPVVGIKEFFKPVDSNIIENIDGSEMIMLRGNCYPIIRIHKLYDIETNVLKLTDGMIIVVEQDDKSVCIFADELLGQQQVVVKSLPNYIKRINNIKGISGCTLLGDGSISLILSISEIMS